MTATETIDKLIVLASNMPGYDLCWEWMEPGNSDTEYIARHDVLELLNRMKNIVERDGE